MKNTKIHLLLILLSFSIISCEEIIEFRGESLEPKIVLYSVLDPENTITVNLSASYPVFQWDYKHKQIENAEVELYRDGKLIETLSYLPPVSLPGSFYTIPYSTYTSESIKPSPESTYRIEARVPGYKTVGSEVRFPSFIPIEHTDTSTFKNAAGPYSEGLYLQAKIRLRDIPGEDNYYRIRVYRREGFYSGDKQLPYSSENPVMVTPFWQSHVELDPIMQPSQENELFGNSLSNPYGIFTDELISGMEYDLTLKFYEQEIDTEFHEFYLYNIELHSISRELYLYLRSLSAYQQTEGDFISEPVIVYTNINNGLGIFGTQMVSRVSLSKGEYPADGVTYEDVDYFY